MMFIWYCNQCNAAGTAGEGPIADASRLGLAGHGRTSPDCQHVPAIKESATHRETLGAIGGKIGGPDLDPLSFVSVADTESIKRAKED